ncbi:hypothetical protein AB1I77_25605 [Bacillus paranthracis]|uniref:hypothetical protein n=1 Tax=Bacillus cereus group TaxID=86661 RepID=UPI00330420C5|nr:hypothetical protein [Bacillus toyonensis]
MSYQTKEQSIGYLFRVFMNVGTNRNELKEVYAIANELIETGYNEITNHDTQRVLAEISERNEYDEEKRKELNLNLMWAFNDRSVYEAGELYKLYKAVIFEKL